MSEELWFSFQQGQELYLFSKSLDWLWGPPSFLFKGHCGLFSWV
jgi:hypothetical protein